MFWQVKEAIQCDQHILKKTRTHEKVSAPSCESSVFADTDFLREGSEARQRSACECGLRLVGHLLGTKRHYYQT